MTPEARSYSAGKFALILDGVNCGFLKSVDGGNARAEVVNELSSPDYFVKKHIAGVKYEDFILQIGLQMSPPVYQWLTASWSGANQRKSGEIIAADYNLDATSEREFFNALITETTFPACDGASKEPAYMTLKFAPEYTRYAKGSGKIQGEVSRAERVWLPSNFRLEIAGLDCSHVNKIDSFTVKQTMVSDDIGDARDYAKEPGKLEFPNLKISLAEQSSQNWYDWFDDFVIKGDNDESKEKSGTLVFLSPDSKTELARINFFNLGIFKLASSTQEASSNQIKRVTAELYCERMEFVMPEVKKVSVNPMIRDLSSRRLSGLK